MWPRDYEYFLKEILRGCKEILRGELIVKEPRGVFVFLHIYIYIKFQNGLDYFIPDLMVFDTLVYTHKTGTLFETVPQF